MSDGGGAALGGLSVGTGSYWRFAGKSMQDPAVAVPERGPLSPPGCPSHWPSPRREAAFSSHFQKSLLPSLSAPSF